MRAMKIFAGLVMLLLFVWIGIGCSNPDNLTNPDLPETGEDVEQGDSIDPDIPVPFADYAFGPILDFAFEKDGDLAISDASVGVPLFDSFGIYKDRNMTEGDMPFTGMIDLGPGLLDNGKAVIITGPPIFCSWFTVFDDAHVVGGGSFRDTPAAGEGIRTGDG